MPGNPQTTVKDQLKDKRFQNDEAYKKIQKTCIKLQCSDILECNRILRKVILGEIISKMKGADSDYAQLFQTPMFGGSFYKNLKVDKPNEFDLCLMINLCKSIDSKYLKIEPDDEHPSYVKIKVVQKKFRGNERFWNKVLDKNGYLNQNKFRSWMQGIIDRTFKPFRTEYETEYNECLIVYDYKREDSSEIYTLHNHQSGPAFTIHLTKYNDDRTTTVIDFDLVPCLVFQNRILKGFRPRKASQWIAIAKPKKPQWTWRAGFFNDEKKILSTGHIKPVIRMVKKLRDIYKWDDYLKSYYIETLFYHELDKKQNSYFARNYYKHARTAIFMYMIRLLYQKLKNQKLVDYWHKGFNLLSATPESQLKGIANQLLEIIEDIESNIENNNNTLLRIFKFRGEAPV